MKMPTGTPSFVARHKLGVFFILAYVLSWYPWLLALMKGRTTGPNPLGPFVAAILATALAEGRPGLRIFFSRIVRWRIGAQWYALVFMFPIVICLVAVAITLCLTTGVHLSLPSGEQWRELPERFLFIFLFIGLGEEPGWRGFALPQLQKENSPLMASLILAPLWALWHLPLMGSEFPLQIVPPFVISVLGGTLVQTWFFNRTKGSVLAQMLIHATVNTVGAGLIFPLFTGTALTVLWWIYAFVWLIAGAVAISLCARKNPHALGTPLTSIA